MIATIRKLCKRLSSNSEGKVNELTGIIQSAFETPIAGSERIDILRSAAQISGGMQEFADLLVSCMTDVTTEEVIQLHVLAITHTILALLGEAALPVSARGTFHERQLQRGNAAQRRRANLLLIDQNKLWFSLQLSYQFKKSLSDSVDKGGSRAEAVLDILNNIVPFSEIESPKKLDFECYVWERTTERGDFDAAAAFAFGPVLRGALADRLAVVKERSFSTAFSRREPWNMTRWYLQPDDGMPILKQGFSMINQRLTQAGARVNVGPSDIDVVVARGNVRVVPQTPVLKYLISPGDKLPEDQRAELPRFDGDCYCDADFPAAILLGICNLVERINLSR